MAEVRAGLQAALGDAYRIERELGGGGMSRVFVAEELALGRKVVVKVLPPEMGAGVNAERFRREIQLAASLQHPHIVPLLSAGQRDDLVWYTMPLIEGQSLREKLVREGELPVGDVVRILRDVADALAFAHERGVMHRDIKPDNVLLSGRHAVVTDFGVAKAISDAAGSALTTAGVALGTPAYMAPEQATAAPSMDHRADIYALGAMAYEMLTGAPPFAGDAQAVLRAHVVEAPTAVSVRRAAVPPALDALVMRCLEKKAADRWQSAAELHTLLEGMATPSGGTAPTAAAPAYRRGIAWWIAAGVVVVLIALGPLARGMLRAGPEFVASDIRPVSNEPGVEWQPAISPDGRDVAFVAGPPGRQQLVLRSAVGAAAGGELRLDDSTLGSVQLPRWSADGEFVRFLACAAGALDVPSECAWREMARRGGAVRTSAVPGNAWTAAWSADGSRIAYSVRDSIFASSSADGSTALLAVHTDHPGFELHSMAWSPNARLLAYVNRNAQWVVSGNISPSSIWVVKAGGGVPARITDDDFLNTSPTWLDDGHLLFVSNRDGPRGIYVVEVGPAGARGEPQNVLEASDVHSISYSAAARRLVYARLGLHQNIRSYPIAPGRPVSITAGRSVTSGNQVVEEHDLSPDGRWIAYDNNLGGSAHIYKLALERGAPLQLTSGAGDEEGPRWSPDGTEIAFYNNRRGEIFIVGADGGAVTRLARGVAPYWSPDGLHLAFMDPGEGPRRAWIATRDRAGVPWHAPVLVVERCMALAWLADGSGVRCGNSRTVVSATGAILPNRAGAPLYAPSGYVAFSRDGGTAYSVDEHEGRRGIWAVGLRSQARRLVVAADDPALDLFGEISLGRDRLFASVSEYESDIWVMKLQR